MPPRRSEPEGARSRLGSEGERAALSVYSRAGFTAVARNWRCSIGELDLVLERGELLVFCEVKARSGDAFGGGYEAVGWRKRRKVRQLAEVFIAATGARPKDMRFDVASVDLGSPRGPFVEIFEDAF